MTTKSKSVHRLLLILPIEKVYYLKGKKKKKSPHCHNSSSPEEQLMKKNQLNPSTTWQVHITDPLWFCTSWGYSESTTNSNRSTPPLLLCKDAARTLVFPLILQYVTEIQDASSLATIHPAPKFSANSIKFTEEKMTHHLHLPSCVHLPSCKFTCTVLPSCPTTTVPFSCLINMTKWAAGASPATSLSPDLENQLHRSRHFNKTQLWIKRFYA